MLNNHQLTDLAQRMRIPLEGVFFKSQLKDMKLQFNKSYIINLEDEYGSDGEENLGSHYTTFQYNKYPDGEHKVVYFDSFGVDAPIEVLEFCKVKAIPHNTKDIQSLMNEACGWFCLAFLHFINSWEGRSKDLYEDCEHFTSLFHDLNVEKDHKFNEWVLKMFFKSPDDKTPHSLADVGFKFIPEGTNVAEGIAEVSTITE